MTAFFRGDKSIDGLKSELGVEHVVIGNFSEAAKIASLSKEHDIVINAGSSSSGELVSAIVEGLKQRSSKGKLIHVSGGGNFIDLGSSGEFNPNSKVWSVSESLRAILESDLMRKCGRTTTRRILNKSGRICLMDPQIRCQHSKDSYVSCP